MQSLPDLKTLSNTEKDKLIIKKIVAPTNVETTYYKLAFLLTFAQCYFKFFCATCFAAH